VKEWFENTKAGVITWMVAGVLIALIGVSWIVAALADGEFLGAGLGGLLIFAGSRAVFQSRQAFLGLASPSSEDAD
jgi:hypothetical protein